MKRGHLYALITACCLLLYSCAPVLDRDFLDSGSREVSFLELRKNPDEHKGRLFVFGGVIVQTKLTREGSELEAMHVPVDRYGYFQDRGRSQGRFIAVMPAGEQMLDPEVFRKTRRITMAGEFIGLRTGRIEEMEYTYPVFRINQIHLWEQERQYYPAYYYDPWFYPYPYYYWNAWWSYPYYYSYPSYRSGGPVYRRPPPSQPPPSQAPAPPTRRPESTPDRGVDRGVERDPR
jgi:outer membrane lipoprotein